MVQDTQQFGRLEEIRQFVDQILCERDRLVAGMFPLIEQKLWRKGQPWGVMFRLLGPRQVQLTALWDSVSGHILFYSSSGQRFQTTKLTGDAPEPNSLLDNCQSD